MNLEAICSHKKLILVMTVAMTAIWTLAPTAFTLTSQDLGGASDAVGLRLNSFAADATQNLGAGSIVVNGQAEMALGDTVAGAIEASIALPAVRTALVDSNYSYRFTLEETSGICPDCWSGGELLRIQVYGFDSDLGDWIDLTPTSDRGLFVKQDTATAFLFAEGVTVTVDLGTRSDLFESFNVIVEQV